MSTSLAPYPRFKAFITGTNQPLVGGMLYAYQPGTSTPVATYTDISGNTANPWPVVLDSNGEADIWLNGQCKLVLQDSFGVQVWSKDNIGNIQQLVSQTSVSAYSSLTVAVAAIGGTQKTLIIDVSTTLTGNTAIPSTLSIQCVSPGTITSNGFSLNINGPFSSVGNYTIFLGFSSGNVTFNQYQDKIQAEWFGEVGDNSTDNTSARSVLMGCAIASGGRKIVYGPGIFIGNYTTPLSKNPWSIVIEGHSMTGTQIKGKASANVDVFGINVGQTNPLYWPSYWIFRNLTIDGNNLNNSTGSCLSLFQCNLFKLENVNLQNGAEWNIKIDTSIGIKTLGASTIWGNTLGSNGASGLGSVFVSNSSDVDIDSVALQSFTQASQWPIKIQKLAGYSDSCNIIINQLYLEANKNGIYINDATTGIGATGMDINITPSRLVGLAASGGTLFNITGDIQTRVLVVGGNAYNSWDSNWIKISVAAGAVDVPQVRFVDVSGICDVSNFQEDHAGYIATWGEAETYNYIPNGDFSSWDTTSPTVPLYVFVYAQNGGTISKQTGRDGVRPAFRIANPSVGGGYIQYTFSPFELNNVKGKILNSSLWCTGDAANAGYIAVVVTSATLGGTKTLTSIQNHGTSWERLRLAQYIPQDTTSINIYLWTNQSRTFTMDQWTCTANYVGPFTLKDQASWGGITFTPGIFATGLTQISANISVVAPAPVTNGYTVQAFSPYDLAGCTLSGYVNSANSARIVITNNTGANSNLGTSAYWLVRVSKP